jgi:hypothetical protein
MKVVPLKKPPLVGGFLLYTNSSKIKKGKFRTFLLLYSVPKPSITLSPKETHRAKKKILTDNPLGLLWIAWIPV